VDYDWLDQVGFYGNSSETEWFQWNLCSFMYMQMIRFFPVEEQAKRYGDVNFIVFSKNM
jgi:hypothetical protein